MSSIETSTLICSKCRQRFTRRWNANRHCNNKHSYALKNVISNKIKPTNRFLYTVFSKNNKSNSIYFKKPTIFGALNFHK